MRVRLIERKRTFLAGLLMIGLLLVASGSFRSVLANPATQAQVGAETTRSDASSENDLERAVAVAELAEAEYRSAKENNERSPGTVSRIHLRRLGAKVGLAKLNVERAKLAGSDDEAARREIELERAVTLADLAEARYCSAKERGDRSPGAVPEMQLRRLRAKMNIAKQDVALARLAGSDDQAARQEIELERAKAVAELTETTKAAERQASKREAAETEEVDWGPATEGVRYRLRAENASWPQGTTPKLFVDLQNQGKRDLSIAIEHESWEIEIDGKWHSPSGGQSGLRRSLPLSAGQTQRNVEVWDWLWENMKKAVQELPLGKHTIRVACTLPGFGVPAAKPLIRVVSNPIEVEVVAAEPVAPAEFSGGWTDIERVMASLRTEFADISSTCPQLPDADAVRIARTGIFYGLRYIHDCTYYGKRGHEDTGPHPVHLRFEVYSLSEQGDLNRYAVREPDHTWNNLGLVGWTRVYADEDASSGFPDKARHIINRHVAMVDALDRRAKDSPPPVAKDWGWAVEGVQLRLHADRSSWPQGTLPKLLADFRNRGTLRLSVELQHAGWEFEIDGTWYRATNAMNTSLHALCCASALVTILLTPSQATADLATLFVETTRVGETSKEYGYLVSLGPAGTQFLVIVKNDSMEFLVLRGVAEKGVVRDVPWGEAVDGVQVRLRDVPLSFRESEVPAFRADMRNRGSRDLHMWPIPVNGWEIQVDGQWYHLSMWNTLLPHVLAAGGKLANLQLNFETRLQDRPVWVRTDDKQTPLEWSPGKHTVRVAVLAYDPKSKEPYSVRAESNPFEVKITPGELAHDGETAWGPAVEGIQCRLRPVEATWQVSELNRSGETQEDERTREQLKKAVQDLQQQEDLDEASRVKLEEFIRKLQAMSSPSSSFELKLDMRNRSKRTWYVESPVGSLNVEWDGTWFHNEFLGEVEPWPIRPGETLFDRPVHWGPIIAFPDGPAKDGGEIKATPGWHKIRLAISLSSDGQRISVVSNPVKTQVLALAKHPVNE